MPKQVEKLVFHNLSGLNKWLGREGKNHHVISITEDKTSFLTVFAAADISNEEWYDNETAATDAANARRLLRGQRIG